MARALQCVTMNEKKKASGRNIPEAERGRQGGGDVQVKLRLPEEVRDDLYDLAERWGLTISGTVARMIEMVNGTENSE